MSLRYCLPAKRTTLAPPRYTASRDALTSVSTLPPAVTSLAVVDRRARMEHLNRIADLVQALDRIPEPRRLGVASATPAPRRRCARSASAPAPGRADPRQRGCAGVEQARVEQRQDELCLRIAKATVEFDHFRARTGQHQPGIEYPAIRRALGGHAIQRRPQDCAFDVVQQLGCGVARPRESAHAARVGSAVAVQQALVVTRRRHDGQSLTVGEHEHGQLVTLEELLDQDLVAGGADAARSKELIQRVIDVAWRKGDMHALAGREPIGLDRNRQPEVFDRSHSPRFRIHHRLRDPSGSRGARESPLPRLCSTPAERLSGSVQRSSVLRFRIDRRCRPRAAPPAQQSSDRPAPPVRSARAHRSPSPR